MKLKRTILPLIYSAFFTFCPTTYSQNNPSELYPVVQNNKWEYINKEGKIIIIPQFDGADEFTYGVAAIQIGKKYGYIDRSRKIIIRPIFDVASQFSNGLAGMVINDKVGFIDKPGKFIIKPQL
jgi:hypothetical protein